MVEKTTKIATKKAVGEIFIPRILKGTENPWRKIVAVTRY